MKLLVIHGPNLNMLGRRETGIYGTATLEDINRSLRNLGEELDVHVEIVQSNDEAKLIESVHGALEKRTDGIVINPGAYTHTSIALRDAMMSVNLPFVEVHISNTFARESFRHQSYLSDVSAGVIIGLGPIGYLFGMRALVQILQVKHVAQASEKVQAAAAEKPAVVPD